MKKFTLFTLFCSFFFSINVSQALTEPQAEDIADLSAIFVYLKNDCGYDTIQNEQIRRVIILFANQNRFDLSDYNNFNLQGLGQSSYSDLKNIPITTEKKCNNLAPNALRLLTAIR